MHYCDSGCCLKNKLPCAHFLTQYPDRRGVDYPMCGTSRIVPAAPAARGLFWGTRYPKGVLVASDVLRHALLERTNTCLPYCKPSSANITLKPDQELVVN